jgi:tetratricopeptide (TPR) repeat protein
MPCRARSRDPSSVDPILDLRVDDHPDPLVELARLVRVARAYQKANRGDDYLAAGDNAAALAEYRAAMELAPELEELAFWHGLALAESGKLAEARGLLAKVYRSRSQMRDLVPRLQKAGWVQLSREAMQALTQG